MLEQIINDQVTAVRTDVYVKLVDEGLERGAAAELANNFDFGDALASA